MILKGKQHDRYDDHQSQKDQSEGCNDSAFSAQVGRLMRMLERVFPCRALDARAGCCRI